MVSMVRVVSELPDAQKVHVAARMPQTEAEGMPRPTCYITKRNARNLQKSKATQSFYVLTCLLWIDNPDADRKKCRNNNSNIRNMCLLRWDIRSLLLGLLISMQQMHYIYESCMSEFSLLPADPGAVRKGMGSLELQISQDEKNDDPENA